MIVAILTVVVLVLSGTVAALTLTHTSSPAAVTLQPVQTPGANPFMPPVGTDRPGLRLLKGSGGTFSGGTPGLYGGTLRKASCNPQQMVSFLDAHPDKAAAWASVLGIRPTDIPGYVAGLTPVVLRSDTAVTNHGYADGHVTSLPAILQAGTAVLIDRYGQPVTKCFCGNPLTKPTAYAGPTYTGRHWASFSPASVTVIKQSTVVINSFILVDPATGSAFRRPSGSSGSADQPGSTPSETAPASAYVANAGDGTVTPIDLATGTPGSPITVGHGGGLDWTQIAITPDGKTAYVTDAGDGTVTPITVATDTTGVPITVGQGAAGIAITPDGKTAYVANGSDTVTPIDLATGTPGTPITVGNDPLAIAITPDGKTAYVTNGGGGNGNTVTPIDLATGTPGTPITVGNYPYAIAITPDGKTAYVTSFNDGTVTPITVATDTTGAAIPVGQNPSSIAITPDGKTAYLTNGASGAGDTVTPIDLATGTPGTPITVGNEPMAIAITPDGKTAYVGNYADGTVTPITLATGTPGTPITVGNEPFAIAITPSTTAKPTATGELHAAALQGSGAGWGTGRYRTARKQPGAQAQARDGHAETANAMATAARPPPGNKPRNGERGAISGSSSRYSS